MVEGSIFTNRFFSRQVTLSLIRLKMTSAKAPWTKQFKSIFQTTNTLKLGTFMGGFAALFRVTNNFAKFDVKIGANFGFA